MYLIVGFFCLKELLKLDWGFFIFHMPQDFYFPASDSVSKGWFVKPLNKKGKELRTETASAFSCCGALPRLGVITRQVSGSTQEAWANTVGSDTVPMRRRISSKPGYDLGAMLRSDMC